MGTMEIKGPNRPKPVQVLAYADDEKLRIFERNIMRKMYKPVKTDEGYIEKLMSNEITNKMKGEVLVTVAKAQRVRWHGYIHM